MKYLQAPKKTIQKIQLINLNGKNITIIPRRAGRPSPTENSLRMQIPIMLREIDNIDAESAIIALGEDNCDYAYEYTKTSIESYLLKVKTRMIYSSAGVRIIKLDNGKTIRIKKYNFKDT